MTSDIVMNDSDYISLETNRRKTVIGHVVLEGKKLLDKYDNFTLKPSYIIVDVFGETDTEYLIQDLSKGYYKNENGAVCFNYSTLLKSDIVTFFKQHTKCHEFVKSYNERFDYYTVENLYPKVGSPSGAYVSTHWLFNDIDVNNPTVIFNKDIAQNIAKKSNELLTSHFATYKDEINDFIMKEKHNVL